MYCESERRFLFWFFFCKKIFFYLYLLKTFCEIYIKCNSKIKFGAVSFCHFVLSHLGMLNSLLSSNAIRYWLLKIRDIFSLMIFQVYFSVKIWQLSSVRKSFKLDFGIYWYHVLITKAFKICKCWIFKYHQNN